MLPKKETDMTELLKSIFRAVLFVAASVGPVASCSLSKEADKPTEKQTEEPENPALKNAAAIDFESLLDSLPNPGDPSLTTDQASEFAKLSLQCVDREYPNKPSHVADGDDTVKPPRELHPAFFGCFDWHSAVHGHWAMLRLLKKYPKIAEAKEIRAALSRHLTEEKIRAELEYFKQEHHNLFERPYGWGWLLRLKAEVDTFDDPGAARWSKALHPLAEHISGLTGSYLNTLSVPVREGTHQSTAFALAHIHDYAKVAGDEKLKKVVERRARDFFGGDVNCPSDYEPSGEDFISPCLAEADLMRRILAKYEFAAWLDKFLRPMDSAEFGPLLKPIEVKDRKDPKIGHLIGLFFQRAAAFRGIARALPEKNSRRKILERLGAIHREAGLQQMLDSGYGGEHWLASFAIYLLTESGPY
jgi:hypothetical protein